MQLAEIKMNLVVNELDNNVSCIRLTGRLDVDGAGKIETPFTAHVAAGRRHALIDLGDVSFIASMGIRLLISSARALSLKGGRMVLFGAQEPVQRVLEEAAIDQIIPLAPNQDEALARLNA